MKSRKTRRNSKSQKTNRSSDLPIELWSIITSKLSSLKDRVHFRSVCRSWRSLLTRRHPPCLMFDEFVRKRRRPYRNFMCLGKQETYRVDFPEIHKACCIGSEGNWLITVHEDKTIRLTEFFSRHQIHLPGDKLTPRLWHDKSEFVRIALSSPPGDERNCIAMAIHAHGEKLSVARPGDTSWTSVPSEEELEIQDIIFYKEKFYAVCDDGRLMVCDVGVDLNPTRLKCIWDDYGFEREYKRYYLVQWLGELLVVVRCIYKGLEIETTEWIKIYVFDFTDKMLSELNSLGEHSLFLGHDNATCVCVLASDYYGLVRKNCIYFVEDGEDTECNTWAHNMSVFDLKDKKVSRVRGFHYIDLKFKHKPDSDSDPDADSDSDSDSSYMLYDKPKYISTSFYSKVQPGSILPPVWIVPAEIGM